MYSLPAFVLAVVIAGIPSFPMPEAMDPDAAEAFRHSAVNVGPYETVHNQSDLDALKERATLNATLCVSNTTLDDLQNDNLTQQMQIRYRERKRQERLILIQSQILQRLRMSEQPNISASGFSEEEQRRIDAFLQRVHQLDSQPSLSTPFLHQRRRHWQEADRQMRLASTSQLHNLQSIMQRFQSFYPSCSLPNNTDQDSWELPGLFGIYYDFPSSRFWLNGDVTVLLAKLRLFKFSSNNLSLDDFQRFNSLDSMVRSSSTTINVSIYQYLRPLRQNKRERKRLLESKMLSLDYEGWVEFDVVSSVNVWLYHRNRNFGLVVEVHDVDGNKINPNLFFRNRNCSLAETSREPPFPNIAELHPEITNNRDNESSLLDNETYPTLDLQTAEVSLVDDDMASFTVYSEDSSSTMRSSEDGGRSKRSPDTTVMHPDTTCHEERLYVTFQELDMDQMVISPKGFEWVFCNCPSIDENNQQDHVKNKNGDEADDHKFMSRLRSFWQLIRSQKSTSQSHQCLELDKRPLTLLYMDDSNGPILATLQDFVPTRCSCNSSS